MSNWTDRLALCGWHTESGHVHTAVTCTQLKIGRLYIELESRTIAASYIIMPASLSMCRVTGICCGVQILQNKNAACFMIMLGSFSVCRLTDICWYVLSFKALLFWRLTVYIACMIFTVSVCEDGSMWWRQESAQLMWTTCLSLTLDKLLWLLNLIVMRRLLGVGCSLGIKITMCHLEREKGRGWEGTKGFLLGWIST